MTDHVELPDRHRCAYVDLAGERCHFPGTMSRSTQGTATCFCQGHFGCDDKVEGAQIVVLSTGWRDKRLAHEERHGG